MQWIKIERDEAGFATEKALNEMADKLPIVVVTQFNEHGIDQFFDVITRTAADCMQFIAANPRVTHYLELPKINKETLKQITMANLAIRGHETRGNEVIEILKMLGGKNVYNLSGDTWSVYYALENGEICYGDISNGPYTILSLEEFLEKFPYKVGDYARLSHTNIAVIIKAMKWENNEVVYQLSCSDDWWSVDNLKQYKEETMEEPKELLIGFTKDTDGNWVLNTHKDYEIKEIDGKFKLILKKPTYPKTYKECCEELMGKTDFQDYTLLLTKLSTKINEADSISPEPSHITLINNFYKLLICRDAYWKIAGEQMGLGKLWKPKHEYYEEIFFIYCDRVNGINKGQGFSTNNFCLVFPTAEMRDAFYENFKDLIEQCKELL